MIEPSSLNGKIKIPPSKSLSHRAVIAAGLSDGVCNIDNINMSEDITATCEIMEKLGVKINKLPGKLIIEGSGKLKLLDSELQCNESGSTLRFLIPVAMLTGKKVTFHGKGKLAQRPLNSYYEIFDKQNINYTTEKGGLPLTVEGKLKPGVYELRGDVSSQFITGLIYALPLLEGDSTIKITTEMESIGYIDLTIDVLKKFGVTIENKKYREFYIKGNQKYLKRDYRVEGDFSQVAFFLAAGVLGGEIECLDMKEDSLQGDKVIVDIIKEMGGKVAFENGILKASKSELKGTVIDASQCPDLVPIAAVLGALSEGTTEIINAARVRIKESDRLKAIAAELNKIGADVVEREDSLLIHGKKWLKGGTVNSWNDHRIAMAMAVASIRCTEKLVIEDSGAVKKSYPHFYEDFKSLGGKVDEWTVG